MHLAPSPRHFALPLTASFFALTLTACPSGGTSSEANATASLLSVDPSEVYPGVEVTVSFELAAGEGTSASDLSWRVTFGDGESTTGGDIADTSASHSYADSGSYTVTLEVLSGDAVVASDTLPVEVLAPVDLVAESPRAQPANANTGEPVTVSVDLSNALAGDVVAPFLIGVFLSATREATLDDLGSLTRIGDATVSPVADGEPVLTAGAARSFASEFVVPNEVSSGDYYVVVVADPDARVADEDRANNLAVSQTVLRLTNSSSLEPDLLVRDVLATPDRAFPALNRVTRGYTVSNVGSLDVFQVVSKTYVSIGDDQLDDSDTLIDTSDPIDVVPARGSVQINPTPIVLNDEIVPPDDQELEVWVIVEVSSTDPQTSEATLDNNSATSASPIVVSSELVDGPDVSVRGFAVSPESTFLEGTLEFELTLANEGNVDLSSFFCGVYLGDDATIDPMVDVRFTNIQVAALASGEERTLNVERLVPGIYDPGTYFLYVVCDPLGALSEPFRSNNQLLYPNPITITDEADVDLFVDSVTVPDSTNEGDQATIIARVCVEGTNPSGTTTAELFRTPGAVVDFNADPLTTFTVENVNPGECEDVEVEITVACDQFQEEYAFGVAVDVEDVLPETNEGNNGRVGSSTMTVAGPFCACIEDAFEPNNRPLDAKPIPLGATSGALCDAGTCDYFQTPQLSTGDSLVVRNSFEVDKGVLRTTLYSPNGLTALDTDRDASSPQEVTTFLVPVDGAYVVEVCGTRTSTRNFYDLEVSVLNRSSGVDLVARSVEIPAQSAFSVGEIVPVDFEVVNIGQLDAGAFEAAVVASPTPTLGDGDDVLLGSFQLDAVLGGGRRDETLEVTLPIALADAEYYFGVRLDPTGALGDTDPASNDAVGRSALLQTICFDALEPNDSFQNARNIIDGSYANLDSCTRADDYYEICADNAKQLTVTLNFTDSLGDIDLELYDAQLQRVASSSQTGVDSEQVVVPYVNGAQCYYARAYLLSAQPDASNTYSIDVNIVDVAPSLRCDSLNEPNDDFTTASSLLSAIAQGGTIDRCPLDDEDYYSFAIGSPGQRVSVRAIKEPSTQPGTLRLQLFTPSQSPGPNVETAPDQPIAELRDYVAAQGGTYYVKVTASGNTNNITYRLEVDGLDGVDLRPENLLIGPGSYLPDDEVRLGFDIANLGAQDSTTSSYQVFLGNNAAHDPALDVSLDTFTPPTIPGSGSIAVTPRVTIPITTTTGDYYIHVVVSEVGDLNANNDITSVPIRVD